MTKSRANRYVCIHGHFYQPPREDPWRDEIARQPSAAPYADWNERITSECYAPNGWARILNAEGRIDQIVNNYSRISFNFGPTLLSWLEVHRSDVYEAILEADVASRGRFNGHGSAIAQTYNHLILPLANRRDKETQIRWGLVDFQTRFGRHPEGMWLAETAVDLESLDIMAEQGIRYTILAPSQAHRIRRIGDSHWNDAQHGRIDPTRAYEIRLPSGRRMALFFYDGPISQAIAFERLLENGERLVHRLLNAFSAHRDWSPLVHISTDGETYGHHHSRGEMALAYALERLEQDPHTQLTNYGEYLEQHPPQHEVEIWSHSSWSCVHGVDRWQADCGCSSGMHPGWHQRWRKPYRDALDWLRDQLAQRFDDAARGRLEEPWEARSRYVDVLLDRSETERARFLNELACGELEPDEEVVIWKLLEMQRHCMLMYTSCGWFFDEVSGLETVQTMRYAARAIELAEQLFGIDLTAPFLRRLELAPSNASEFEHAADVYRQMVLDAKHGPEELVAEYAVRSLLGGERDECSGRAAYEMEEGDWRHVRSIRQTISGGSVRLRSVMTREVIEFDTLAVLSADRSLTVGVQSVQDARNAQPGRMAWTEKLLGSIETLGDSTAWAPAGVRLWTLADFPEPFRQQCVLWMVQDHWRQNESGYRSLFERQRPFMQELVTQGLELPSAYLSVAEAILSRDLMRLVSGTTLQVEHLEQLLEEAQSWGVSLQLGKASGALERFVLQAISDWADAMGSPQRLDTAIRFMRLAREHLPEMSLTRVQNRCFALRRKVEREGLPAEAAAYRAQIARLADLVGLNWTLPEPHPQPAGSNRAVA